MSRGHEVGAEVRFGIPETAVLRARHALLQSVRSTLYEQGFIEVQPPIVVDGPALEENIEALPGADRWMHTSPEFALKRVLASGLPRIFAITPVFRAEEQGRHHAAEFTMLEFYLCNANYLDLIPLVETLVWQAARALGAPPPAFRKRTVAELFGGSIPEDDDSFFRHWVEEIDPALTQPTFVLDYPARHAALAEVRGDISERLELYLGGLELGNGFSELRDPAELRQRFADSAEARKRAGRTPHPTDEGVIAATARLPRCAGIAIGVDRLLMALLGIAEIHHVQVR